jgi:hypothetical protein
MPLCPRRRPSLAYLLLMQHSSAGIQPYRRYDRLG